MQTPRALTICIVCLFGCRVRTQVNLLLVYFDIRLKLPLSLVVTDTLEPRGVIALRSAIASVLGLGCGSQIQSPIIQGIEVYVIAPHRIVSRESKHSSVHTLHVALPI